MIRSIQQLALIMEAFVQTSINDGIAKIIFFHPQSNSLPGEILRKLAAEISAAGQNQAVKVIVRAANEQKIGVEERFCCSF